MISKDKFLMWVSSYAAERHWITSPEDVQQWDQKAAELFTKQIQATEDLRKYLRSRKSEGR